MEFKMFSKHLKELEERTRNAGVIPSLLTSFESFAIKRTIWRNQKYF